MTESLLEKHNPVCDVVVVNYNSGEFLKRCVTSVLHSTIPVHLTVVDNASKDDSIEHIADIDVGFHHLDLHKNAENLGFSCGVNIGANMGEAPYIFLLNPDCEIHPHTITNLIEESKHCADFGVMGALVFSEDGTEQRGCRRLEPTFKRSMVTALSLGHFFQSVNLQNESLPSDIINIDAVSGSAMLIDRDVFSELKGMDEAYFLHVEDLDFCRRVRESGKKIYFTPHVSLFHHLGASSHDVPVHTEWHKHQGMLRYQHKFQKPNQSAIRSFLTRVVIYLHFMIAIVRKRLAANKGGDRPVQSLIKHTKSPVLITGARSDLGHALLRALPSTALVIAFSRSKKLPASIGEEIWFNWAYLEKVPPADFSGLHTLIQLSPIWAGAQQLKTLRRFDKISRIIALSSTSVLSKADSGIESEQRVIEQIAKGEQDLLSWAKQGVDITICRASMIYGGQQNQNIAFIKRMIKRFRFFPMLSEGAGLRQPSHIDDLAQAVCQLTNKTNLPLQTYILAGGEQLSYREMIERVFIVLKRKKCLIVLPKTFFLALVAMMSHLPGLRFMNPEMVKRIDKDMVYDINPARQDFDYHPGKFRP